MHCFLKWISGAPVVGPRITWHCNTDNSRYRFSHYRWPQKQSAFIADCNTLNPSSSDSMQEQGDIHTTLKNHSLTQVIRMERSLPILQKHSCNKYQQCKVSQDPKHVVVMRRRWPYYRNMPPSIQHKSWLQLQMKHEPLSRAQQETNRRDHQMDEMEFSLNLQSV